MSKFYSFAYAVGFAPWEKAGQAGADGLALLLAREEAERGGPGKALDLGCGSGMHVVTLAQRGWKVTGVDLIDRAVDKARARVRAAGVEAQVLQADVTALSAEHLGSGFDFFLDLGCFHGLTTVQQRAMADRVTALATPSATLIMLAFATPIGPKFMPQGARREDIEGAFAEWSIEESFQPPAGVKGMPRMVAKSGATFYRLRRRTEADAS